MSKICGNCGAPASVDGAVFCNQCGARFPDDTATCPSCGREVLDPLSRFCDQCGSPIPLPEEMPVPPAEVPPSPREPEMPPPVPKERGQVCPACGYENEEKNRFYCRKCGAYIRDKSAGLPSGTGGVGAVRQPKAGPIRIKPDGMDAIRQRPVFESPRPAKQPPAPRRKSEPRRQKPLPYRKIAIAAAAMVIIAVIALVVPGMLGGNPENATAARSLAAPGPGAPDEKNADSPLSGLFAAIDGLLQGGEPVSNKGTPVFGQTTPVSNKGTPVFPDKPLFP